MDCSDVLPNRQRGEHAHPELQFGATASVPRSSTAKRRRSSVRWTTSPIQALHALSCCHDNTFVSGSAVEHLHRGGVRPAAPGSVKGAFLIYVVAALLAIVGAVLLVTSKTWDAAIAASAGKANASGITAESLANAVKIATIVVTVIIVGLYLLFAFKMRAGRNWARVVLTVLSALSIANTARSSSSITVNNQVYSAAGSQVFSWLGAILAILAIVLMFLPASNAYFTASKAARQRR